MSATRSDSDIFKAIYNSHREDFDLNQIVAKIQMLGESDQNPLNLRNSYDENLLHYTLRVMLVTRDNPAHAPDEKIRRLKNLQQITAYLFALYLEAPNNAELLRNISVSNQTILLYLLALNNNESFKFLKQLFNALPSGTLSFYHSQFASFSNLVFASNYHLVDRADLQTLLHYAIQHCDERFVLLLIKKIQQELNAHELFNFQNPANQTALHLAWKKKNFNLARELLFAGANMLAYDKDDKLPFEQIADPTENAEFINNLNHHFAFVGHIIPAKLAEKLPNVLYPQKNEYSAKKSDYISYRILYQFLERCHAVNEILAAQTLDRLLKENKMTSADFLSFCERFAQSNQENLASLASLNMVARALLEIVKNNQQAKGKCNVLIHQTTEATIKLSQEAAVTGLLPTLKNIIKDTKSQLNRLLYRANKLAFTNFNQRVVDEFCLPILLAEKSLSLSAITLLKLGQKDFYEQSQKELKSRLVSRCMSYQIVPTDHILKNANATWLLKELDQAYLGFILEMIQKNNESLRVHDKETEDKNRKNASIVLSILFITGSLAGLVYVFFDTPGLNTRSDHDYPSPGTILVFSFVLAIASILFLICKPKRFFYMTERNDNLLSFYDDISVIKKACQIIKEFFPLNQNIQNNLFNIFPQLAILEDKNTTIDAAYLNHNFLTQEFNMLIRAVSQEPSILPWHPTREIKKTTTFQGATPTQNYLLSFFRAPEKITEEKRSTALRVSKVSRLPLDYQPAPAHQEGSVKQHGVIIERVDRLIEFVNNADQRTQQADEKQKREQEAEKVLNEELEHMRIEREKRDEQTRMTLEEEVKRIKEQERSTMHADQEEIEKTRQVFYTRGRRW